MSHNHVSAKGDDEKGDGSFECPFKTIARAFREANGKGTMILTSPPPARPDHEADGGGQ